MSLTGIEENKTKIKHSNYLFTSKFVVGSGEEPTKEKL